MRNKFKMFVSYNFTSDKGWGIGNNTSYHTCRKYLSTEDIREIEKDLMEEYGYTSVTIINYQIR